MLKIIKDFNKFSQKVLSDENFLTFTELSVTEKNKFYNIISTWCLVGASIFCHMTDDG